MVVENPVFRKRGYFPAYLRSVRADVAAADRTRRLYFVRLVYDLSRFSA
jgi:hypothetical protein